MFYFNKISVCTIILLFFIVLLSSCKKEYSYEGGIPAVYTLYKTQGACANFVVNGNYIAGVVLDSTNSIQLQAHVILAGIYSLQTNNADGIYFSTAGNFKDTGNYIITLKGNGKPQSEGIFSFLVLSDSCSIALPVKKMITDTAVYTMAGAPSGCTNPVVNGSYTSGKNVTSLNTVTIKANVTSTGVYTIKTDTVHGLQFADSGIFTTIGMQDVILKGNGTPTQAGRYVFTPVGTNTFCNFIVDVINAEPLATYVLESGGDSSNSCVYQVNGNYTVNKPVTASNTISIRVFATILGNFTVATDLINGLQFSYTGTFTTIGAQVILLSASGTPATVGTFKFIPAIIGPHPIGGATCATFITVQ